MTEAVTIAIAPAIADAEQQRAIRKPPGSLDAWGAYQRGLWHLSKASAEDNALAEKFFQRAIDLDPIFTGGTQGLPPPSCERALCFTRGCALRLQSVWSIGLRCVCGPIPAATGLTSPGPLPMCDECGLEL
jgi:hypothetical protein